MILDLPVRKEQRFTSSPASFGPATSLQTRANERLTLSRDKGHECTSNEHIISESQHQHTAPQPEQPRAHSPHTRPCSLSGTMNAVALPLSLAANAACKLTTAKPMIFLYGLTTSLNLNVTCWCWVYLQPQSEAKQNTKPLVKRTARGAAIT
jgi:hypothetical protein